MRLQMRQNSSLLCQVLVVPIISINKTKGDTIYAAFCNIALFAFPNVRNSVYRRLAKPLHHSCEIFSFKSLSFSLKTGCLSILRFSFWIYFKIYSVVCLFRLQFNFDILRAIVFQTEFEMWKQVCRNKFIVQSTNVRHFLSEAYKCSEAWENRLRSPILQKIRPDLFYYDLDRKFQKAGKICAIDLDIFVHTIKDNTLLNELSDLVHKMRLTAETSQTLASTSHAVIRHHLDYSDNDLESLIYILDDRLSYGIFLDPFTANLCLDKLIKLKNYRMAAKVATFLMLQENFNNPINRTLSLYACYKYLDDPQSFDDLIKNEYKEDGLAAEISAALREADPKAKKAKKREKKEEIRVRINYLRNPYFDDHFDLRNSHHLVGKTFLAISQHLDGAIRNSIQLIGYTFYEKYSEGNKCLESLTNSNAFYKDAVEIAKKQLDQVQLLSC